MKKLLVIALLFIATNLYGADTKLSELTETTIADSTDLLYIVDGATSKKITVGNLEDSLTISTDIAIISSDVGVVKTKATIISNDISYYPISIISRDVGGISTDISVMKTLDSIISSDVGTLKTNVTQISVDVGNSKTPAYIVQTSNAQLTNEQALSTLTTGIMYVTNATGAVTSLGDPLPIVNGGTASTVGYTTISNDVGVLKTKTTIISNDIAIYPPTVISRDVGIISRDIAIYKPAIVSRDIGIISSDVADLKTKDLIISADIANYKNIIISRDIGMISSDVGVIRTKVTQMSADAVIWNGGALTFILNGGGSVLTNTNKAWITMPYAANILSWDITALPSGSVTLNVMKDVASNFPPLLNDSIAGTFKPFLASDTLSTDTTLTGWTTALNKYDYIVVSVDSATTSTQATLVLTIKKN